MKYIVKAEFVDRHTGTRHFPAARGEEPTIFEPHDDEQRQALTASRCISEEPVALSLFDKEVGDLSRSEMEVLSLEAAKASIAKATDDQLRDSIAAYRGHLIEKDDTALEKLTADQLRDVAAEEGVPLDGISKKADIIAAIKAKREAA